MLPTTTLDHIPYSPPRDRPLDPPELLSASAANGPVVRVRNEDGSEILIVTGHAMNKAVLENPRFTADGNQPGFPLNGHIGGMVDVFANSMLRLDDPDHSRLRAMIAAQFRPRAIRGLAPLVAEAVRHCRDLLAAQGPGADLVPAYSSEIPSIVISRLIGIPERHRARLKALANSVNDPRPEGEESPLFTMGRELREIIMAGELEAGVLLEMSKEIPRGNLSIDELVAMAVLLTFGGHETTGNTMALGSTLLLPDTALMDRLRAETSLLPTVVEEVIRVVSVTRSGPRRLATEDVEIDGYQFRQGDGLIMGLHVANRDESVFPAGDALDLGRERPQRHLAFSAGLHVCLGQFLAREELAQGFGCLINDFEDMALVDAPERLPYKGANSIYSLASVPVTWTATKF